jgi:hypothetical protein
LCTTKNKYLITVHMLKCREEQTTWLMFAKYSGKR